MVPSLLHSQEAEELVVGLVAGRVVLELDSGQVDLVGKVREHTARVDLVPADLEAVLVDFQEEQVELEDLEDVVQEHTLLVELELVPVDLEVVLVDTPEEQVVVDQSFQLFHILTTQIKEMVLILIGKPNLLA